MTRRNSEHAATPRRPVGTPARYADFAALAVMAAAPGAVLLWLVPLPLFLPALGIVSFALAGLVALAAHRTGIDRRGEGVTAWGVAGLFTVMWIVAGLMGGAKPLAELSVRLAMSP